MLLFEIAEDEDYEENLDILEEIKAGNVKFEGNAVDMLDDNEKELLIKALTATLYINGFNTIDNDIAWP